MIAKESPTKETLGMVACCVMVAVNLGIALVALIVALVDDGPPRSPAVASAPPAVDEANYEVPANPYIPSGAPSSGETAGLIP
jgi:hypothetical protein